MVVFLGLGWSNLMAEELSCDELQGLASILDEVADVLSDTDAEEIAGDKEFDDKLGKLLKALQKIAEIEESEELGDNIEEVHSLWDVEGEWTEDEWAEFKRVFDSVINSFERIHSKEC